jgi:2-hydroxychromene-2-carboxylate isomerase
MSQEPALRIVHYFDYKSPYAYLAEEETRRTERDLGVTFESLPYTLDIPSYLGRAEVDDRGRVISEERTDHQWRRVRYAYMDCRREAARRGLVIRGPRKIFDSSTAHVGFLWARRQGDPRRYHDAVFERFWRRELDLESVDAIEAALESSGIPAAGFREFLAGDGRAEHDRIRAGAEARGVFGVPSYLVGDELFWGSERIARVRERIDAALGRGTQAPP